jgi:predicted transcriptional regulator
MQEKLEKCFDDFSDTEIKVINESTMELLGFVYLSRKYRIPESFIYKILKRQA